jgi:hypothetical protein
MPVAGGPNTLGESNLVFAYDTSDVKNSYRGQPTTNAVGNLNSYNPLDLYTWAPNGNTSTWTRDYTLKSPVGGISLKQISSGTDSYSDTYNSSQDNIIAASSGQTWTVSVYALAAAGTNLQVWIFGANSSGNYIELNANSFTATGVWQRISVTMTFTNGSTAYVQSRVATSTNGGVVWWDGLQVEQKSYPTSFTTGTRSVTQGLLPLVGNSTIDLSNVSFDSNAKMTFDGTNDYASVTLPSSIGVYCLEMVWYNNNAIPNNDTAIGGPTTYQTPIEFNGTGQGVHLGAWTGGFTNEAIHIWGAGGATANQVAAGVGHHHVVFNWNGTTYDIWVDGINTPTQYLSGNNPATLLTASSIKMGNDVSGYAFNGQIPITKIYNRALTAQEVRQNYQQYKTRFNLS